MEERMMSSSRSRVTRACRTALSLVAFTVLACAPQRVPESTGALEPTPLDEQPLRMVSAFFGLDNALGPRAAALDGMPVVFSRRVEEPIDPTAFTVVTRSGARLHPLRATTRPASETAERHTVLLVGQFGDEPDDPPAMVEVTGQLAIAGGADPLGMSVPVTPLADGPSLVLAFASDPAQIESNCTPDTRQIIVVVWAGGVRPRPGVTLDDHRLGYSVATTAGAVVPTALGNLGDGDNYEHLCLDTVATPLRASMRGGLLMDPRDDPNPATDVDIAGRSRR
jgi:hypothetical protein